MAKTASATKKAATKHTDQPEIVISPTLRSGTSSKANASEQAFDDITIFLKLKESDSETCAKDKNLRRLKPKTGLSYKKHLY